MPATGVYIKGLRTTRRKLKEMPDEARSELTIQSNRIAVVVGDEARSRFTALGRQGPLVGASLKTASGTTPTIKVGGSARVGASRKPVYKLLYGTEFGSNKYRQFHALHTGTTGRALWPTIRQRGPYMVKQWTKALDKVTKKFGEGGDGAEEKL